jgi:hypothetical protein
MAGTSHFENESAVFGNVTEMVNFDVLEKFSSPRRVRLPLGNKVSERLHPT